MKSNIIISLKYLFLSTIVFGFLYTGVITIIGKTFFKEKANGSLITKKNIVIGSKLIAQEFKDPKFFWGRPSAANFANIPSGASNYGAINKKLKDDIDSRISSWKAYYPNIKQEDIPAELLMSSASGLDPHISINAALFQVDRIIKVRNISENKNVKSKILKLIYAHQEQSMINVLQLNLALEQLFNE